MVEMDVCVHNMFPGNSEGGQMNEGTSQKVYLKVIYLFILSASKWSLCLQTLNDEFNGMKINRLDDYMR